MATPSIRYMLDGDTFATRVPSTAAGLQTAIDALAGGKGKVYIGPGTLEVSTVISVHSGCYIQGSGVGSTVIKRAASSIAGGASESGNVFMSTDYGSNGSLSSSIGAIDIAFSHLTIDGNSSNQGGADPGTPHHHAIKLQFVDGVRISQVEVKNTLLSGIYMNECRRLFVDGLYMNNTGAYGGGGYSQNGLTLVGNTGTANYNRDAVVKNVESDTTFDAHIFCNWSDAAFSNVTVRAGKIGFECETTSTSTQQRIVLENWTAQNLTRQFFSAIQASGTGAIFSDYVVRNVACAFASSTHESWAIQVGSGDCIIRRVQFQGCVFSNINSSDMVNRSFAQFETTNTSTASTDITLKDCTFLGGASSSTHTTNHGVDFRGHFDRVTVENCVVQYAAGRGMVFNTVTSGATIQRASVRGCNVLNSNMDGILFITSTGGTLKNIDVKDCYIEDSCESASSDFCGIRVGPATASTTGTNMTVSGNRIRKASSTGMVRGIRIEAGAAATSDTYILFGNDIIGLGTGSDLAYQATGTSTNVQFDDPVQRGPDVTSAATVTLRPGTLFHVTGTTNISTLNPCVTWERRAITFIFDGALTFTDGSNLKLNGNLATSADDTITLRYDGSNWHEIARSVN